MAEHDCDYCSEGFADEDAYLDHLAAEHEGELGSVDRHRVENHQQSGGRSLAVYGAVGVLAVLVGAVVAVFVLGGGGGAPADGNTTDPDAIDYGSLPDSGDSALLSGVQTNPSEGSTHVAPGTDLNYGRMPPDSGPHYGQAARAGFYGEADAPALGRVVHSLEHGAVVVYYDPAALTPEARESLRRFAEAHTDPWASFIAMPTPVEDPGAPYVVTAWRHRMTLEEYDARRIKAFAAEYLGRGPENQVR